MTRTEAEVRNFFDALGANSYDVGICGDLGMLPGYDRVSAELILRRLKFFGLCNSRGEHIYLRPAGENAYTLLDDLSADTLRRLHREGFEPAAVVETSPNNFQAWLRHEKVLPRALSTLAARKLAARFGGDPERPTGDTSAACQASPTPS